MTPALATRATRPRLELIATDSLDLAAASAGRHARRFVAAHPRSLTTAVVLALAGFAATAFGIAPMVPDASDLPKRLVTEAVTPSGMQAQLDALAEHALQLYRTDLTRSSDTADSLLKRLNVSDAAAALFLRADPTARKVSQAQYDALKTVNIHLINL